MKKSAISFSSSIFNLFIKKIKIITIIFTINIIVNIIVSLLNNDTFFFNRVVINEVKKAS